jgi:tetratricopeptide (TPR) repeat protein
LAGAALGLHAIGTRALKPADELAGLLEEALAGLGSGAERAVPRARVLASLARLLAWPGRDLPRARELAQRAVAEARTAGDRPTQASCVLALHNVIWGPGTAAQRLDLDAEVIELARAAGDRELEVEARLLRVSDLLELADPAFRGELAAFLEAAETLRQPRLRYLALSRRATLDIMAGRFEDAERRIGEAAALAAEIGEPDGTGVRMEQLWEVRSAQGRRAELAAEVAGAGLDRDSTEARGFAALALLEQGRLEEARAIAEPLLALEPADLPRDYCRTVNLTYAAEGLAAVGDDRQRLRVYQALEPLEDGTAVAGAAVAFKGAIAHHLGLLAAAMGWREAAVGRFSGRWRSTSASVPTPGQPGPDASWTACWKRSWRRPRPGRRLGPSGGTGRCGRSDGREPRCACATPRGSATSPRCSARRAARSVRRTW